MVKWWTILLTVALLSLLFIAIPVSYKGGKSKKELQLMFDEYVEKFNKTYKDRPDEYATRLQHFTASLEEIEQLNSMSRGPDAHKARYGLTRLSDMSKAEYKEVHLSDEKQKKSPHEYNRSWSRYKEQVKAEHLKQVGPAYSVRKKRAAASLNMTVDWNTKGVIGPVKNQGLCGACWAFSTIGTVEAMAAIKTGKLVPLSVQEAIDCATLGNAGCAGGDICLLLDWLYISKTAIVSAAEYPLRLVDGVCRLAKNATGVRIKTFTCDDFVGAEDKILEALATHGPVTVAVNALTWQNYLGGVIQYHCSGAATDLNHAVELVGYDLTAEVPYYIAKNSWGPEFGNGGYLKLAIGTNVCGLANEVASVDVV
ncbi:cathepsin O-like [Choristoneura fumiferana]|uniref:cathepsin O-like n=1 Tax=Choristoneura fumiferana TaxID=7141 RepID=UPI003D15CA36